jgi:hypothetical protein
MPPFSIAVFWLRTRASTEVRTPLAATGRIDLLKGCDGDDDDCSTHFCGVESFSPSLRFCTVPCDVDADCPVEAVCVAVSQNIPADKACIPPCVAGGCWCGSLYDGCDMSFWLPWTCDDSTQMCIPDNDPFD